VRMRARMRYRFNLIEMIKKCEKCGRYSGSKKDDIIYCLWCGGVLIEVSDELPF